MLRSWAALILSVVLVVFPLTALGATAAGASSPSAPATASVEHETPPDMPRFRGKLPELPSPPASFNLYDGGWIRFAYPPATRERVQPLIHEADSIREELSKRLGQSVLQEVHVHVARTPGEMSTLAPEGAPYPKYASGVAYSQIGLILLTINPRHPNALHDLGEVFKHELAHVALNDAVKGSFRVPRWFNEGFAVHASGESSMARLRTLWTATLAGNLMPLAQLERGFPTDSVNADLAYAQSADVVRFLMRQRDVERFSSLIHRVRKGQSFESAVNDAYSMDMTTLEYDWREEVAKRYSFWPVFFSGSLVWVGAVGLFVAGWWRRKKRTAKTLERWAQEEAREDARRVAVDANVEPQQGRVHIVLPSSPQPPELPAVMRPPKPSDAEIPKVEHDGRWHTLH